MDMTLPLGAHLATPRTGYHHHGIYVGDGRVAHYAGYGRTLRRGPVEIVDLAAFAGDAGFWVATDRSMRFSGAEIARRALARVGEDRYSLLQNNCEHFCAWCITGEAISAQVESLLDWPRLICRIFEVKTHPTRTVPAAASTASFLPAVWRAPHSRFEFA